MVRVWPLIKPKVLWFSFFLFLFLPLIFFTIPSQALTISIGEPFSGSLIDPVSFPSQLAGYKLRDEARSYATPEVVGAILDALDRVEEQFPNSCDLFFGDFSREKGGWMKNHRSHQNGRDVDLGMYAKNNLYVDGFVPMNSHNLDVAKTWCLIEGLLSTQRVQRIFVDKSIQALLYRYALNAGADPNYLDRLFMNVGTAYRESVIQHVRGHQDHLHVRFFAPWSTLAGQYKKLDPQKRMMIEMAQQAYLPKKVNYYVKGNEPGINALARSFGVQPKELCRWNGLHSNDVLTPGNCLVFYKRGFEIEPVHLARSLQPHHIVEANPIRLAALPADSITDLSASLRKSHTSSGKRSQTENGAKFLTYKVRSGDTMWRIAKSNGVPIESICKLNRLKNATSLKPGQILKLAQVPSNSGITPKASSRRSENRDASISASASSSSSTPRSAAASTKDSAKTKMKTAKGSKPRTHTIQSGESLWGVARKYQISTRDICRLNGLSAKAVLQPGMQLILPAK